MRSVSSRIMLVGVIAWDLAACIPLHGADQPRPATPAADSSRRAALGARIARDVGQLDDSTLVLRFDAPMEYAHWRDQVRRCSGRARAGEPAYWVAQTAEVRGALALYSRDHTWIVFGLGNERTSWIVMHELLHHELESIEHDPEYFERRCAALVSPRRSP